MTEEICLVEQTLFVTDALCAYVNSVSEDGYKSLRGVVIELAVFVKCRAAVVSVGVEQIPVVEARKHSEAPRSYVFDTEFLDKSLGERLYVVVIDGIIVRRVDIHRIVADLCRSGDLHCARRELQRDVSGLYPREHSGINYVPAGGYQRGEVIIVLDGGIKRRFEQVAR